LYRKFQGILNKLTPQKFQKLAEQALVLDINTVERLSGCIDKIFTKASSCNCECALIGTRMCLGCTWLPTLLVMMTAANES
jgi:hypothetical protein